MKRIRAQNVPNYSDDEVKGKRDLAPAAGGGEGSWQAWYGLRKLCLARKLGFYDKGSMHHEDYSVVHIYARKSADNTWKAHPQA